jgi:hypothetical protein
MAAKDGEPPITGPTIGTANVFVVGEFHQYQQVRVPQRDARAESCPQRSESTISWRRRQTS